MSDGAADYAIAIVGGGLVGASLALALAPLGLRIAVVEAVARGEPEQPSFDERTTALANGSVRTFATLGVWTAMERDATPIRKLHVSEQGRFGVARIDAAEQGLPALGYVVPNRAIGRAVVAALDATPAIDVLAPARVVGTELVADRRHLDIESGDGTRTVTARLVVAADGAHSLLRELCGVGAEHWDYEQTAIVTTVTTQRFHDHVAYERFTSDGPIAVLPLRDGRCGIVWTRRPEESSRVLGLGEAEFMRELQDAFGMRLGRFVQVGRRHGYELALTRADRHTAPRLAIVGNAAQGLHPIAGQGFNLGLRDAASLAEVIAGAMSESAADVGDGSILDAYADWRDEDRRRIVAFTDGLVRIFGSPLGLVRGLRSLGLLAFDALPPAKDALSRLSVGAAGRVPRLARGVPLVSRNH
jgi:2-octaprenyl-6-methoxyphenol hydroxylase